MPQCYHLFFNMNAHKSVGSDKEDRYSDNEGYNIFFIKESQHVRVWQMLGQKLDIQFDLSVTVFHKKKV